LKGRKGESGREERKERNITQYWFS
jgi:hypothetical protein